MKIIFKKAKKTRSKITHSMCLDTILPNQTAVDLARAEKWVTGGKNQHKQAVIVAAIIAALIFLYAVFIVLFCMSIKPSVCIKKD